MFNIYFLVEMDKKTKENWKEADLNVDSLWIIGERDKSGKHANVYHGNFIPQIPNQLIRRYTQEGDTVMELFSGSGTTLFECEALGRDYIGFDINRQIMDYVAEKMAGCANIRFSNCDCDVTDEVSFKEQADRVCRDWGIEKVDFLIAHPPYMDIVKFTQDKRDLSLFSCVDDFFDKFRLAMANGISYLKKGKYLAVVGGDVYKHSEVVPLAFHMMNVIKQNFNVKMKGIVIKNIEGNKGKLGTQDIWKYRALQSDYFLFKHEYIFVFKKMDQ